MTDERCAQLESQVQLLTERVHRLEGRVFPAIAPASAPIQPPPVFAPPRPDLLPPPPPKAPRTGPSVDLTPSRLLAVAGGLVLLLGVGYLLRYAVVQGWLGPHVRVLLALVGSATLAVIGVRLERPLDTRTIGQICTATASAGAYAAAVAAVVLYHLVPDGLGLLAAATVAGAAIARGAWTRTPGIAALGVGGALASPLLIDAHNGAATLGLLLIVLSAGLAVAVRRDWPGITALAVVMVTPQLWSIGMDHAAAGIGLAFAAICGLLIAMAGVAHARSKDWPAAGVAAAVVAFNATSTGALGYFILGERLAVPGDLPGLWLAAVAFVHGLGGIVLSRRYFAPPLAIVLSVAGALVADAAVFELTGGYAATVAVGMLAMAAAAAMKLDWFRVVARLVAATQLAVLAVHATGFVVADAATGSAEAVLLVTALCAAAVAFAALAVDSDRRLAAAGGAVFAGLAVCRLLSAEAPLMSLLDGPADLGTAIIMCLALTATGLLLGQLVHRAFAVAGVAVANYALSLAAVSLDPAGIGRVALTGLWAAAGGVALVAGRRRPLPGVRRGGAALLAAAVTKAALVDTTTLDGTHRAVALLLCGGVLVATAVAEARAAGAAHDAASSTP